jgi:hypothetical protein
VESTEIENLETLVVAKLNNRTDTGIYKEIFVVGPESP